MAHDCCRWQGVFEETVKHKGRKFYVAPERPDAAWQCGLLTLQAVEGVEKGLLKEGSEARAKFNVLISRYPDGVPLVPPTARNPAPVASSAPVQPPAHNKVKELLRCIPGMTEYEATQGAHLSVAAVSAHINQAGGLERWREQHNVGSVPVVQPVIAVAHHPVAPSVVQLPVAHPIAPPQPNQPTQPTPHMPQLSVGMRVQIRTGKHKGSLASVTKLCLQKVQVSIDALDYLLEYNPGMLDPLQPIQTPVVQTFDSALAAPSTTNNPAIQVEPMTDGCNMTGVFSVNDNSRRVVAPSAIPPRAACVGSRAGGFGGGANGAWLVQNVERSRARSRTTVQRGSAAKAGGTAEIDTNWCMATDAKAWGAGKGSPPYLPPRNKPLYRRILKMAYLTGILHRFLRIAQLHG